MIIWEPGECQYYVKSVKSFETSPGEFCLYVCIFTFPTLSPVLMYSYTRTSSLIWRNRPLTIPALSIKYRKKSPERPISPGGFHPVYPHIYFAEISSKFPCIFPVLTYTDCKEIRDFSWAGRKTQVHRKRGSSPLFFYKYFRGGSRWKNWVFFIDESGDFGEYDYHSPYYIITMVFMIRTRISNQLFQNWTGSFLIWI